MKYARIIHVDKLAAEVKRSSERKITYFKKLIFFYEDIRLQQWIMHLMNYHISQLSYATSIRKIQFHKKLSPTTNFSAFLSFAVFKGFRAELEAEGSEALRDKYEFEKADWNAEACEWSREILKFIESWEYGRFMCCIICCCYRTFPYYEKIYFFETCDFLKLF